MDSRTHSGPWLSRGKAAPFRDVETVGWLCDLCFDALMGKKLFTRKVGRGTIRLLQVEERRSKTLQDALVTRQNGVRPLGKRLNPRPSWIKDPEF